jgi:hypothetical protein
LTAAQWAIAIAYALFNSLSLNIGVLALCLAALQNE